MQNNPQTIYFCNLLIATVILSYETLKSNNFEKLTYNANMIFLNAKNARLKMVRSEKKFFVVFSCQMAQEILVDKLIFKKSPKTFHPIVYVWVVLEPYTHREIPGPALSQFHRISLYSRICLLRSVQSTEYLPLNHPITFCGLLNQ